MGATRMLSAYPEMAKDCSREYLMTLAQTLCQYPREVATQACSPIHGVPRQCKSFRPTAGQIADWCEIRTEPIWERAKLETPALPPPSHSEDEMAEGRARVARSLENFLKGRVIKQDWFKDFGADKANEILGISE